MAMPRLRRPQRYTPKSEIDLSVPFPNPPLQFGFRVRFPIPCPYKKAIFSLLGEANSHPLPAQRLNPMPSLPITASNNAIGFVGVQINHRAVYFPDSSEAS
jgi:hypothetical protein